MSLPAESRAGLPFGLSTVTIGGNTHVVESADIASEATRTISRADEFGDRKDFMIRKTGEPIEGSMTLQRDTTAIPLPRAGEQFTYDADDDGTNETYIVKDAKLSKSTDAFDIIEISVARIDI
jgi:hypothetical protein